MSTNSQIPEQLLQWLYANLTRENYRNANHAYSDIVHGLSNFPSVKPRTELFTFNDGQEALLLLLQGTIPTNFMGTSYQFPTKIWIPHLYPQEPPLVFVIPGQDFQVRVGQHVDSQGRIYHPYLAQWAGSWQSKSIANLLFLLSDVFGHEPPLSARGLQQTATLPNTARGPQQVSKDAPPLPPKLNTESRSLQAIHNLQSDSADSLASSPPPLPPKPRSNAAMPNLTRTNGYAMSPPQARPAASGLHRPDYRDYRAGDAIRPRNPGDSQQTHNAITFVPPAQPPQHVAQRAPSQVGSTFIPNPTFTSPPHQRPWAQPHHHNELAQRTAATNPLQRPAQLANQHGIQAVNLKQPPPDIMDMPLEVTIPSQHGQSNAAAPPIPPNPEKNALLEAIGMRLRSELESTIAQNKGAIPALRGQQSALQQAYHLMQAEMGQLDALNNTLTANEKILSRAMREAERVVEKAGRRELPDVDDLLIAPTTVGEQLYKLVAEERSISDALFVLAKALARGRVAPDVFVRHTRALAREQFLKKVVIKKAAHGMGLDEIH